MSAQLNSWHRIIDLVRKEIPHRDHALATDFAYSDAVNLARGLAATEQFAKEILQSAYQGLDYSEADFDELMYAGMKSGSSQNTLEMSSLFVIELGGVNYMLMPHVVEPEKPLIPQGMRQPLIGYTITGDALGIDLRPISELKDVASVAHSNLAFMLRAAETPDKIYGSIGVAKKHIGTSQWGITYSHFAEFSRNNVQEIQKSLTDLATDEITSPNSGETNLLLRPDYKELGDVEVMLFDIESPRERYQLLFS